MGSTVADDNAVGTVFPLSSTKDKGAYLGLLVAFEGACIGAFVDYHPPSCVQGNCCCHYCSCRCHCFPCSGGGGRGLCGRCPSVLVLMVPLLEIAEPVATSTMAAAAQTTPKAMQTISCVKLISLLN